MYFYMSRKDSSAKYKALKQYLMALQSAQGQFEFNNVGFTWYILKMPVDLFHLGWKMHSTSERLRKSNQMEIVRWPKALNRMDGQNKIAGR